LQISHFTSDIIIIIINIKWYTCHIRSLFTELSLETCFLCDYDTVGWKDTKDIWHIRTQRFSSKMSGEKLKGELADPGSYEKPPQTPSL